MKRSALYEGRHSAQRDISQSGGCHGCTSKMLAFYSNVGTLRCNQRSHQKQKMVKAKSALYKHGHCYLKVINLNLGIRWGKTEIVCHWSFLMLLAPAQQSIQLLKCHISRWRLCHRSPQDKQSKSRKKSVISVFLSLITSHAISTSRAGHTPSYRGRATTSFISYHQLKTCPLLSKDNQSKSWEKMWAKKLKLFFIGHFLCCWN